MTVSRETKKNIATGVAIAGAIPLVAGIGTVLFGGLSAAFNAIAAVPDLGVSGITAVVAGGLLGGASAAIAAYRAFNNGLFGRQDPVSGVLFVIVACPLIALGSAFLGSSGSAVLSERLTPPRQSTPVQKVNAPSLPIKTVSPQP